MLMFMRFKKSLIISDNLRLSKAYAFEASGVV
jgi:hypothetical protein